MDEEEFTDKNLKDTFLKDLQNPPPSPLPPRQNSFADNNERTKQTKSFTDIETTKDFFSKSDQMHSFDLVAYTEKVLN